MFRCSLLAFLIVLAATASYAITTDDHRRIHELISERNYLAAVNELQQLNQSHRDKFEHNNYDYLLARVAHRSGQFGVAMANYQAVATRGSVLRGYALWHLAEIARGFGNPMLERQYLRELQFTGPESPLKTAAANRIARSHYANGDYVFAKVEFEQLLRGTSLKNSDAPDRLARENLSFLAECYLNLNTGETQTARGLFFRLLNETADATQPDDFALAGTKGLDRLDGANGEFPLLSPEEYQQRAWVYQFNREYENARRHYTIVNEHPAGRLSSDALYQIGRGYSQTNEFAEAAKWYERLQEQFPETDVARDAILQLASAYARVGKYRESASRYQYFIDRFPTDERLDRAYLNMIDIARDQGEEVEALRRAANAQDVFRGKPAEAQALFAEARIYIAREEWQTAANALERLQKLPDLGGTRVPGGTTVAEVTFLRGFVFEQLLNWPQAIDAYLSIHDGRAEFYGWLATERLRAMGEKPESKPAIAERRARLNQAGENIEARRRGLQDAIRLTTDENERKVLIAELREVYSKLPEYSSFGSVEKLDSGRKEILDNSEKPARRKISNELVFLGLYDEAATEIEADGRVKDPHILAQYYLLGDFAERTIKNTEPKYKLPADFQIELLPPHVAEMLYPAPFADDLVQNAPGRNVDPRFLLAIMRQESRFQPTAKSNAAARGLMQFISTTSTRMAGELQLIHFRQDDLYDPSIAILMGSQYVSGLFTLYPNQPAAVAASYNGGEDNMKRWMGRAKSDLLGRYVPEIMYAQTKDYVYKVMSNYRVYTTRYDENLRKAEARP